jgi:hypothetical protein
MDYAEVESSFEQSRREFGHMLLCWRRRCGWTQYTACDWAKAAGFQAISYGNLSVIEQGKAGELRQKGFWQLGELNRRIAEQDWGAVSDRKLRDRIKAATPLGDEAMPVWSPIEFWACYCGMRAIPEPYRTTPPPALGARAASELSGRWRRRMRQVVEQHRLDPITAITALVSQAPADHQKRFYAVLTGFGNYNPDELAALWIEADTYAPVRWLEKWAPASDTP